MSEKIKIEKFNSHNSKWLNIVQLNRTSDDFNHHLLEDMFIYPDLFLKMDVLCDSSSDNDDNLFDTNHVQLAKPTNTKN